MVNNKKRVWLVARVLTCVLPVACCQQVLAADAQVVMVQGQVQVFDAASNAWRPAAVNQALAAGETVRTGEASQMALLMQDQTQVRLNQRSEFRLKSVATASGGETALELRAGRMWAQAKQFFTGISRGATNVVGTLKLQRLVVNTPTSTIGIRGTDWEVSVGDADTTTVIVFSGEVAVANELGEVSVGASEQATVRRGQAPVKVLLSSARERVQWVTAYQPIPRRWLASVPAALEPAVRAIEAGDHAAALAALVPQASNSAPAALVLADLYIAQGRADDALALLQPLAQGGRGDPLASALAARALTLAGRLDEASALLASARAQQPSQPELVLAAADLARVRGEGSTALALYTQLAQADVQRHEAWFGAGRIAAEKEDVAAAQDALGRAIAMAPGTAGYQAELATLQTQTGNLAAARASFEAALRQHPDDYQALTGLGLLQLKSGQTRDALASFLKAGLIEPRYARAQLYTAVAYYQLGSTGRALETLDKAKALDPNDPLPHLYESLIRNDLLQPGDALQASRRALALLPYLKSLNPVANDQKGSANLGAALAALGLEDWARAYAQDAYYPFWAGSHLFLADRYAGDFNKKSELFQGFLTDPTVFGASNRFSSLVERPGNYVTLGLRHDSSRDMKITEPTFTINGLANASVPVAWFGEVIQTRAQPDQLAFGAQSHTYTVALGARPTYALGLFAYANAFDADITLGPTPSATNVTGRSRITGHNERLDAGGSYRFGPQSQAWLKLGTGSESSTSNSVSSFDTPGGLATNLSAFETRPHQRDVQLRHSFAASPRHEVSWGVERASTSKVNTLVQENFYHLGSGTPSNPVPSDRLAQRDDDVSRDLWFSDRYQPSAQWLLQLDLAAQHYTKTRDINIYRDRTPPATQLFPERYERNSLSPRLGAAWAVAPGATLRGALQKWLRPASFSSLEPVATAGIPVDDTLVNPGGQLTRARLQLDWETSPSTFFTAFADRREVDNLNSPLDGVLNTRADVSNIDRLRQRTVANLAAPDALEDKPVFARGNATSAGVTFNQVITRQWAAYAGYAHTQSANTGAGLLGNALPWLPEHRASLGLNWSGDERLQISAQAVWRSQRFADEANKLPQSAGWDMTLKLHWESADKHWAVDGYAANLFKRGVENLLGINVVARY